MIVRIGIPLCAAVLLGGFPAAVQAQQASLSFFVTSVGKGSGADLGGIIVFKAESNVTSPTASL